MIMDSERAEAIIAIQRRLRRVEQARDALSHAYPLGTSFVSELMYAIDALLYFVIWGEDAVDGTPLTQPPAYRDEGNNHDAS